MHKRPDVAGAGKLNILAASASADDIERVQPFVEREWRRRRRSPRPFYAPAG
jgi:hypothetical protein